MLGRIDAFSSAVPGPDGAAAVRSLRASADLCDRLIVTIVNDRLGGHPWE